MSCEKNSYPSRGFAEKVARQRMRDDRSLVLRVYCCKACGRWHLTKKPDRFRAYREDEGEW